MKAKISISLDEIIERYFSEEEYINYNQERTNIARCIKRIKRTIGMKYCENPTLMGTACIVLRTPKDYIKEICGKYILGNQIVDKSMKLAKDLESKSEFTGRRPTALAAAIIYYYSLPLQEVHKVTQREISILAGISEISLRENYYLIVKFYGTQDEKLKMVTKKEARNKNKRNEQREERLFKNGEFRK
jgi:transcription initiation factor TFIIIB Brf1 subunit/transcription initiation factor TFIIB